MSYGQELLDSNFDNFDPDTFDPDTFDPDNATGQPQRPARKKAPLVMAGKQAQITLKVVVANGFAAGTGCDVELFNWAQSWSKVANTYTTTSAFNPFTAQDITAANLNSLIYFNRAGDLIIQDAAGLKTTISSSTVNISYRQFFELCSSNAFMISKMYYNVTTDGQIDNAISIFKKTMWGSTENNSISPRSYFDPNQYQSKIINIPDKFFIDQERGLSLLVNNNETVTFNMFVTPLKRPSII